MNANKIISISIPLLFVLLTLSCEKSDMIYTDMPLDNDLIGNWQRTYSVVSDQMAITVFTDTLEFNFSNIGNLKIYKFNDLEIIRSFQYYCTDNNIYLKFDDKDLDEIWPYTIRNDSLIIDSLPYKR